MQSQMTQGSESSYQKYCLTTFGELGAPEITFTCRTSCRFFFCQSGGAPRQRFGHQVGIGDQVGRGVGAVLGDAGEFHQHGVRVGMEDARHDGVVFAGMAVAREAGEHPLRGFAIVGDAGRAAEAVDEKAHLIADLFPLGVRESHQDGRAGTEVGERDLVAQFHAIRPVAAGSA